MFAALPGALVAAPFSLILLGGPDHPDRDPADRCRSRSPSSPPTWPSPGSWHAHGSRATGARGRLRRGHHPVVLRWTCGLVEGDELLPGLERRLRRPRARTRRSLPGVSTNSGIRPPPGLRVAVRSLPLAGRYRRLGGGDLGAGLDPSPGARRGWRSRGRAGAPWCRSSAVAPVLGEEAGRRGRGRSTRRGRSRPSHTGLHHRRRLVHRL